MEELVGLATFAAVVRHGSFTEAAAALGESKSVVSRRVSALEQRMGARLLHRTTRRIEVTEVGLAVYDRCSGLLAQAEEAGLAASVATGEPCGTLRVNLPTVLATEVVVPLLPELLARYPGLRVELSTSDRMLDVVGSGFDLTLRIGGRPADASYVARSLATVRLVAVASPAYLARKGVPSSPAELLDHEGLRYTLLGAREEWRFTGPEGVEISLPLEGRFGADAGAVVLAAVLAGIGIGIVPDVEAAAHIADGRLVRVLGDWRTPERFLWAMWPHRTLVPPKVRVMVDHVAKHVAGRC
jgi:DNA-binding transcriptional LysR family regulator